MPKVPSNLSDLSELASTAVGSAASGVGMLVGKAIQAYTEFAEVGGF